MIALLLILITLCQGEPISRGLTWKPPDWDMTENFLENGTISEYMTKWSEPFSNKPQMESLFQASSNDSSMFLTDIANCMTTYNLMECVKMLMITRIKGLVTEMDQRNTTGVDYSLLNGMVVFKWRNESFEDVQDFSSETDLSRKLNAYVHQLFRSRSLQLKLFPGFGVELTPKPKTDDNGLVCFTAKAFKADFEDSDEIQEMRKKDDKGKKKKKNKGGGGFNMMPMMIVPQMIMLGMLPFALANLKMMVMNAFMMNSMALNGAIAMTIRNMVFGPKNGPRVKYVNYGYNKHTKKNKKPEIILHSPAAFVKKPHRIENKKHQTRLRVQSKPIVNENYPPIDSYTPNEEFEHQHDESYGEVDAPVSYLNNNQHIQPSSSNFQNEDVVGSSNYDNSYQAYNNINLQPYGNFDSHNAESKPSYSSTYKENSNYYPNHRLH